MPILAYAHWSQAGHRWCLTIAIEHPGYAQTGSKLSPTIAKAARNWLLWEDAIRLAETDRRSGRYAAEHAEAELTAQREAEATESGQGHAA